ncbi:MAG: phosphoribosylglycinamide formyltransferase [Firmicutes bacterium]|nr:phosphoribosylglycinamide formyltransferase [Bacillota bacterium]
MDFAVFVSGSGSNLQALIDACASGAIDGRIVCVVTGTPGAYALTRAADNDIPALVFAKADYPNAELREEAIAAALRQCKPQFIVLAGFLGILRGAVLAEFRGRIINIHPSLLPAHGGAGMYGIKVHEDVVRCGDTVTGATVHLVDEGTDTGRIIAQKRVAVFAGDTPETLQKRVLAEAEHLLLVQVAADICSGKIVLHTGES